MQVTSSARTGSLTRIIIGVTVALALIAVVGVLTFGSLVGPGETQPLVQLAWVQPTTQSFMIVSALAIAFLCFGRYRALGSAWIFWAGLVFLVNGILGIFYLLSWPGLLGDRGVIAQLSNTASWLFMLTFSSITLLLIAAHARHPERLQPTQTFAFYTIAVVLSSVFGVLSVLFESALPILIIGASYTPLVLVWVGILVVLIAVAAAAAYKRYSTQEDPMLGYVALFLVMMAWGLLFSIVGGKRYDFWWYIARFVFVPAFLVVLFGFLQEGYRLFSHERTRAEERERLVEQLGFERARWQATVDNMLDLVTVCDDEGRVVYINPAYTSLVGRYVEPGLPLEEHPKYYQLFHPDGTMFAPEDLPVQRAALRDREVRNIEIVHRAADGREFIGVFSASPLHDESGRVVGAVAVGRDITQQRRNETEREQLLREIKHRADELDAVNRELEAFSYSVSHDLRAPLRHVDSFGQLLSKGYADKLDETGQEYIQYMREGSQRMSQLIDDLLRLSRVTRGELRRENVDLSELAQSVATELRKEQPERKVSCTVAPAVVANGDPRLLRLVLENLLSNAWKFTSKRADARIEFGVAQTDGQPVYYVRDNGAGFDMAFADKLFAPFQRLHSEEEFSGTGIGLATVQRIIRRHGGRVWAEGQVDRGATVYFTLNQTAAKANGVQA